MAGRGRNPSRRTGDVEVTIDSVGAAAPGTGAGVQIPRDAAPRLIQAIDHLFLLDRAPDPLDEMLDLVPHVLHLQCDVTALAPVILAGAVVGGLRRLEIRCRRGIVRGLLGDAVGLALHAVDQMRFALALAMTRFVRLFVARLVRLPLRRGLIHSRCSLLVSAA